MMKKVSKIVVLLFLAVFPLMMLAQCKGEEKVKINQKIVFIWRYINAASGYQNYGTFVDSEGNKVGYDLADERWRKMTRDEELPYLESLEYRESDIHGKVDMSELEEHYSYLYKIDLDAEVTEERRASDAGQRTLYGIVYQEKSVPTFVLIKSEGNYKYVNTDPYAKKIAEWWGM